MRHTVPVMILLAGALVAPDALASSPPDPARTKVVQVKDARLKFEINATDKDGGIQVFFDADDWQRMSIHDPGGRRIFTAEASGRMGRQGGTELFLESAEPPFSEVPLRRLLHRWPAGRYTFRGVTTGGATLLGRALLTHALPRGPRLLAPLEEGPAQDPGDTVLRWRRVPDPAGSRIIGYQVLVVDPETRFRALPTITLDVMMPPWAQRFRVPRGFLRPGQEYEWEILAVERGGNQTLSSSTFRTRRP